MNTDQFRDQAIIAASTVAALATALLHKLNDMTTEEFARGGEREERRALHAELVKLGLLTHDSDGRPVQHR